MSLPVALITGGARRIGAELVRQFHHEGFNILVHCHQSLDAAEGLAGELNELRPGSCSPSALDGHLALIE